MAPFSLAGMLGKKTNHLTGGRVVTSSTGSPFRSTILQCEALPNHALLSFSSTVAKNEGLSLLFAHFATVDMVGLSQHGG